MTHYVQTMMTGKFQLYDYGVDKNIMLYGSKSPPLYPLEKITSPIYLYAGLHDQVFRKKASN
jgi:lysosomal acid lipase/cholesteryl ester hydrolase